MSIQTLLRRAAVSVWPFAFAATAVFHSSGAAAADASQDFWRNIQARPLPADAPQVSIYRPLSLDVAKMQSHLSAARHNATAVTLSLPLPDGTFSEFLLVDSRTMPDALQDKFPAIVSLAGSDAAGRKARVDISPLGFQAMIFEHDGVLIVRPEQQGLGERYLSFRRADLSVPGQAFQCDVHGDSIDPSGRSLLGNPAPMTTTGATERVYRAAVAANHQYVAAVGGGTVQGGLAAIVTAMNRVNQVYETELGVHMELIPNEEDIIYPSAAGDPYSNDGNALNQNQTNLDNTIGSANYDIGHVFTTGSGGVAGLRVTCVNGQKARGTTGLSNPTGDGFYIDYVAHEMGHQFGGNHTFNSQSSACGGGNRAASAAYEPGSGTTIMAYAGICGADNTQQHSDPYFHAKSLEEINSWIEGNGGACTAETASTDAPPVIDTGSLPAEVTIPIHTPFALSGAASDADGDALTYNWEQYDLGPPTTLAQGDTGDGPIFRSFNASTSGTRIFPKIESVLGAPLVKGETWPVTTRDLSFRLTVRDNHDVPGTPQFGATVSANNIQIHVTEDAGPFAVTRPNTAITWGRGENHLVTWDVAGTDLAPVNCANVAIDLSADGGANFDQLLLASTPNIGTAVVLVPNVSDTDEARVRIACVENVFFDVSDVDFNIAAVGDPDPTGAIASVSPPSFTFTLDAGSTGTDALTVSNGGDVGTTLNYTIIESEDACATTTDVTWLSASPTGGAVAGGASAPVTVDVDTASLAAGSHSASLCVGTDDPLHAQFVVPVDLTVNPSAPDAIFANGFEGEGGGECTPVQLLQDPSFEATDPNTFTNPEWDAFDSVSGTPFCDETCDDGGTVVARTGTWFAWFGGWDQPNTSWLSQNVVFQSGQPRWLNYWLDNQISGDPTASLTLSIDGTPVLTFPTDDGTGEYAAGTFEIPAQYLDGNAHDLRFDWAADSLAGEVGGAIFDDVTLDCEAQPTGHVGGSRLLGGASRKVLR